MASFGSNYGEYHNGDEVNSGVTDAIYKLEVQRLGLGSSEFLFPGNHVDIHIRIGDGVPVASLRSKIFRSYGHDREGNEIPGVENITYWQQNWETGGCYLNPVNISPEAFA